MTRLFDGLSRYICPYLLNHCVGMVTIELFKSFDASVLIILASDMRIEGQRVKAITFIREIQFDDMGRVPFSYGLMANMTIVELADPYIRHDLPSLSRPLCADFAGTVALRAEHR